MAVNEMLTKWSVAFLDGVSPAGSWGERTLSVSERWKNITDLVEKSGRPCIATNS